MGYLMTAMGDGDMRRLSRALGHYGWVYIEGSDVPCTYSITLYGLLTPVSLSRASRGAESSSLVP